MADSIDLDMLCFKSGGDALCYKHGGSALVYKSQAPGEVTVRVLWSPQSYTCKTYSKYHVIQFLCSGSFTSGSGSIVSQTSGGTETTFTLKLTSGPATFSVSTACATPCAATSEDPGVTCSIMANQRDATPCAKTDVSAPRTGCGAATVTQISFDESRMLEGIN